jgi:hypothetical protein
MYKFLLKRKIKKIIKHSERKKAYLNLQEIKSVLVLFDTENFDDASHFIQRLKKMDKKIKAFAYQSKKDTNNYSNIPYTIVTDKDMNNLKGDSLARIINGLENKTFDLVVDLTLKENLLLLYILVSADSPLKVGFYKHAFSVHDIVISFAPGWMLTVKELGKQLIYYLSIISSGTGNNK